MSKVKEFRAGICPFKKGRGFSLIELIIAIAILIILTGLLAPQFIKYIEKSRLAACMHSMDVILAEYEVELVNEGGIPEAKSSIKILNDIIGGHGGETPEEVSSLVYTYKGLCKSQGEYRCEFTGDLKTVLIACSKHGEWELDIVTLKKRLENLDLTAYAANSPYKKLSEYFAKNPGLTLDSEAKSSDLDSYGKYGSLANIVSVALTSQGINVSSKSWMLHKINGQYELYLTDRKITTEDGNEILSCSRYDIKNETITKGTIKVSVKKMSGEPFPVITHGSFKSSE